MHRILYFGLLFFVTNLSAQTSHSIYGNVQQSNGIPLSGVEISLHHQANIIASTVTDDIGNYIFENLPDGEDYSLYAVYNETDATDNTVYDYIIISKHILDYMPLDYQGILSADVNNSGSVTAFDLVEERKKILESAYDGTDVQDWILMPAYYYEQNSGSTNPWSEDFPHVWGLVIEDLAADTEMDIIGIKRGDPSEGEEVILPALLTLSTAPVTVNVGSVFSVDVAVENFDQLSGLQYSLSWDPTKVTLSAIIPNPDVLYLNVTNVYQHPEVVSFLWGDATIPSGYNLPDGTVLCTLEFMALATGSTNFSFSHMQAVDADCLVYEVNGNSNEVEIEGPLAASSPSPENFINIFPNPFSDKTSLRFSLPEAGEVRYRVWNATGELVQEKAVFLAAGINELPLDFNNITSKGVLLYTLETTTGSFSGKLIRE
jgi:hypothetical protein